MGGTRVASVLKSHKIVARNGTEQVGSSTSTERGELTTAEVAVHGIDTLFFFSGKLCRDTFMKKSRVD
jgi:hypothetical protein